MTSVSKKCKGTTAHELSLSLSLPCSVKYPDANFKLCIFKYLIDKRDIHFTFHCDGWWSLIKTKIWRLPLISFIYSSAIYINHCLILSSNCLLCVVLGMTTLPFKSPLAFSLHLHNSCQYFWIRSVEQAKKESNLFE